MYPWIGLPGLISLQVRQEQILERRLRCRSRRHTQLDQRLGFRARLLPAAGPRRSQEHQSKGYCSRHENTYPYQQTHS